jgi:hypothetical protein
MKKYAIVKLSVFSIISIAFAFYLIYYSNALANGNISSDRCFNCPDLFHSIGHNNFQNPADSLVKNFAVDAKGSLYVNVPGADLEIKTWDKNEVKVVVLRKGSEEQLNNYNISFKATQDKVEITANNKKTFWNWGNFSIRFIIMMPKQFYPDLNTSGGDIFVDDIVSDAKIKTSGGDIKVNNSTSNINAHTSGGDINISNNNGDVNIGTSGGDVEIDNVSGKVDAETSGGNITLKLNGENKGIYLHTSGGDIKLNIPQDSKAELDCSTSGGDVSLNGNSTFQGKMKEHSLNGTINGGGPMIKAKTSGGDIVIDLRNK